ATGGRGMKPPADRSGFVYCLVNDASPKIVKVGRTKDIGRRVAAINGPTLGRGAAGLPGTRVGAWTHNSDAVDIETRTLRILGDYRLPGSELLATSPGAVIRVFNLISGPVTVEN